MYIRVVIFLSILLYNSCVSRAQNHVSLFLKTLQSISECDSFDVGYILDLYVTNDSIYQKNIDSSIYKKFNILSQKEVFFYNMIYVFKIEEFQIENGIIILKIKRNSESPKDTMQHEIFEFYVREYDFSVILLNHKFEI